MNNKPDIFEILERAHKGQYCSSKDWDLKWIRGNVRQVLTDHGLDKTCDMENPVNSDYDLADRFYQAAFELALKVGFYCEDTERIVQVSQEELENAIKFAPSELFIGKGKDGTLVKARTPADPYTCKQVCSLGITVSEDIFLQLVTGIVAEKEVDLLEAASLITVRGHEVLAGTPWETLMGYQHGQWHREARRRGGRPGMGGIGSISAVTDYGQFGAYGTPGGLDPSMDAALILFPSEMKIDYRTLNKVIHTLNMGGAIKANSPSMIGGMPGPPEGAVVAEIACTILSYAILQNQAGGGQLYDARYLSSVNREALWAHSVVNQALSRNTHILVDSFPNEVSGPVTANLLYEIAAGQAVVASCGGAFTTGPRTSGGKLHDYLTPLECRFAGEVTHKSSALEPAKVNGIVKELLPLYEDQIKTPDVGKPYQEAYDVATGQPTEEWEAIYRKVKSEVIDLGIPLDDF
jgi:methylamine---corrinoid protein Co-methyltransferase